MASQESSEPPFDLDAQIIDLHMLASEPPPTPTPTYSESLSRLQNGYLHCISVLEARNKALTRELEEARAAPHSQHRVSELETDNDALWRELEEARAASQSLKERFHPLESALATKNEALRTKNNRIRHLEQQVGRLRNELAEERRAKVNALVNNEGSRKLGSVEGKRKWGPPDGYGKWANW